MRVRRQSLLSLANTLGDAYRQEVSYFAVKQIQLLKSEGAHDLSSQAARTMTFQEIKADAESMYNWSLRT